MKKYLSLFLVLVMLVTSMPVYAFADGGDAAGEEIVSVAETTEESAEDKPAEDTKEEKAEKKEEPKAEPAKEEKAEEKPEPVKEEPKEEPKEESAPAKEEAPAEVKTEEEPAPAKEEAPAEEKVEEEPAPVKEEAPAEEKTEEESAPVKEETVTEEETEAPAEDEVVTEEETEAPAEDEVVVEEETEEPAEDEVVTEEETEAPAEDEAVTEEETEEPAEDEVVTEEETEAPAEDEAVTEEETEAPAEEEVLFEGMPIDEDGDGVADGFDVDGDGVIDMLMDGTEVLAKGEMLSKATYPYVHKLYLKEQTDRSVTLKWDDLDDEDGYVIEYIEDDSSFNPAYIMTELANADDEEVTIHDLKIGKSYYFRILAWYDDGSAHGQYSTPTVLGGDVYIRPYPPKNLAVKTYSSTAADLSWDLPDGDDLVDGYYIVRTNDVDDSEWTHRIDDVSKLTYRNKNLQLGVTYTYRVYSSTNIGTTKKPIWIESEKAAEYQYQALPQAPSNLMAMPHETNSIKLTWDEVDGASYYNVYRKLLDDKNYPDTPVGTAKQSGSPSFIDEGVDPGIKYKYAVTAVASVSLTGDSTDPETGETIPGVSADYEGPKTSDVTGVTFPPVPSSVEIVKVGDTFIEFKWNKVKGASGYLLQVSEDGKTYSDLIDITTPDATNYLDKGLVPGQTRFYRIQSYVKFAVPPSGFVRVYSCDKNEDAVYSKPVSATPLPLAPEDLEATNPASYNQIKLTWVESDGASGYYILRGTSAKTAPETIVADIPDGMTTEWTDTGLTCGTMYYYRVQPYVISTLGKTLAGAASEVISYKALPAVPQNLTGSQVSGENAVELEWDSIEGATGYYVYASQDGGAFKKVATVKGTDDPTVVAKIEKLTLYSEYEFKVAAYRKVGDKTYTGEQCEEIEIFVDFVFVEELTAEASGTTKAKVSWKKVDGATGYEVRVRRVDDPMDEYTFTKKTTETSMTLAGLDCSEDYWIEVRLYRKVDGVYQYGPETVWKDMGGNNAFYTSPAKPARLTAKVKEDGSGVVLTWTAVSGADGYIITRSDAKEIAYEADGATVIMTPRDAVAGLTFTDTDVHVGDQFYYHAFAYCDSACGVHGAIHESKPTTATAMHLPAKVLNLKVEGSGPDAVTLSWDEIPEADGYYIYQKKGDGSYVRIDTETWTVNSDGRVEQFVDGLKTASKYTFKVRAYTLASSGGNAYGEYSSTVSYRPAPWPPTNVEAYEVYAKSVKLSWEASEGATSYKIYCMVPDKEPKYVATVKSKADAGDPVYATVKNLAFDTEYTFAVKACVSGAESDLSAESTPITTYLDKTDSFYDDATYYSNTKVKLKWTAIPNVSGYEIEKRESDAAAWSLIKSPGKDTKSYTATGLELGEGYDFRIRGYVTVDGERVYAKPPVSDNGWFQLDDVYSRPTKPGEFKISSWGSDYLNVKWKAIAGADGYNIYWENSQDPSDSGMLTVTGGTGTLNEKITGLSSSTTYKVYIRAYVDTVGGQLEGAKTGTVSRKTAK